MVPIHIIETDRDRILISNFRDRDSGIGEKNPEIRGLTNRSGIASPSEHSQVRHFYTVFGTE